MNYYIKFIVPELMPPTIQWYTIHIDKTERTDKTKKKSLELLQRFKQLIENGYKRNRYNGMMFVNRKPVDIWKN